LGGGVFEVVVVGVFGGLLTVIGGSEDLFEVVEEVVGTNLGGGGRELEVVNNEVIPEVVEDKFADGGALERPGIGTVV
jgi:hypothetical protein